MTKHKQYQNKLSEVETRTHAARARNAKRTGLALGLAAVLGLTGIGGSTVLAAPEEAKNSADVKVDVDISSVLSLAVYPVGDHTAETDQVTLNPIPDGGLATNALDLVVRTNVPTGYQLTIQDKDNDASLVNLDDSTRTIPTLDASTSAKDFPTDRWGYATGAYSTSSMFNPIPTTVPSIIARSNRLLPGDGETTTVTFGAKVGSGIANGTYEDIVVFTASPELAPVTHALTIHYQYADGREAAPDYTAEVSLDAEYSVTSPEVAGYTPSQDIVSGTMGDEDIDITITYTVTPTLTGITKMQEMTARVCAATATPAASDTTVPENTLTDTRDGKSYKVRKLADGKCWMSQDLNYTLRTDAPLTPEKSDVQSPWTPENNTQTETGVVWDSPSADVARSYTDGARTYYNWRAATGGSTDASFTTGDAPGSVCPKGWGLPSRDEYVELVSEVYKIPDDSDDAKMIATPLTFDHTGYYQAGGGVMYYKDTHGFYWSSALATSEHPYNLLLHGTGVNPQDDRYSRSYGFAIRCVAK